MRTCPVHYWCSPGHCACTAEPAHLLAPVEPSSGLGLLAPISEDADDLDRASVLSAATSYYDAEEGSSVAAVKDLAAWEGDKDERGGSSKVRCRELPVWSSHLSGVRLTTPDLCTQGVHAGQLGARLLQ